MAFLIKNLGYGKFALMDVDADLSTWKYYTGVAGTLVLGANEKLVSITASGTNASLSINGGSAITFPAGGGLSLVPKGSLYGATLIFTNTDTYMVEAVY